nr:hypothetical protein [uncultured Draconibacterium sp.]
MVKAERIAEFEAVLDEFAVLISRCQLTYGYNNEGLNSAIAATRAMQQATIAAINSFTDVDSMRAFKIRAEDVEYYKGLFDDYKL